MGKYINIVYEIFLEENSTIEFVNFSVKSQTTQIFHFFGTVNKNSTLKLFPIDISGKFLKKNYFISLNGPNAY